MKIVKCLTPFFALIAVLCFSTLAFASSRTTFNSQLMGRSSDTGASLPPDPSAYCVMNPPYQMQQEVNGWKVEFVNVTGNSYQNNWGCRYLVEMTAPMIIEGEEADYVVGLVYHTVPIDWNEMCNQQYPGAHAEWIPGPEKGVDGAPWGCVGKPGVIYDPAEQSDGTHQVVSGG